MKVRSGNYTKIFYPKIRMKHYHSCPECYEKWECTWDCTIEPDLEDPDTYPGRQFGAHCMCDTCEKVVRAREQNEEKYKTKEFWDVYNGFIKAKTRYVARDS